jgi:hypothetical protein
VSPLHSFGLGARQFRWIPQPELDADAVSGALGLFSGDVVGRSEMLATIAVGDKAAWRGGALSFVWRGSRPGVRIQLFDAVQRLSESRSRAALPSSLDSRLAGASLAIDGVYSYDTWASHYRLGGSVGRLRVDVPSTALFGNGSQRNIAFGDGTLTFVQRGDRSSVSESVSANIAGGRSLETGFTRGVLTATIATSGASMLPVTAAASYGRTDINAPIFEQFSLGGISSPLIDRALLAQRFAMPVLPSGISINSSAFAYRVALDTKPLAVYLYSGSTAPAGQRFARWNRVIGADWSASVPPIPIAGTPAARGVIGVGESLDAPFRKRLRAYVGIILQP